MSESTQKKSSTTKTLRGIHQYQRSVTGKLLHSTRFIALILCIIGIGLGTKWYFNASWALLVFSILSLAFGLGLFSIAFVIGDKLSTFNNIASGSLDLIDKFHKNSQRSQSSGNIVDAEIKDYDEQQKVPKIQQK